MSTPENKVSPERLEIPGPDGMVLKQLVPDDAQRYFDLIEYDRGHLSQHGEMTAQKYPTVGKVRDSIENPTSKLRLGIWAGDTMVGSINLTPQEDTAEIGYWMGKQYTGHGYAAKAVQALAVHTFATRDYNHLFAIVDRDNSASIRTLEKAGFHLASSTPNLPRQVMYIIIRPDISRLHS